MRRRLTMLMLLLCTVLAVHAVGFEGEEPTDGKRYYLFNLYQSKFLGSGNYNGLQATLVPSSPLLFTVSKNSVSLTLKSNVAGNENNGLYILGDNTVMLNSADAGKTDQRWKATAKEGAYQLTLVNGDSNMALMYDQGTVVGIGPLNEGFNEDKALWLFVSEDEYAQYLSHKRFTVAALNVDGMPKSISLGVTSINLNPDAKEGPGATAIGQKLKTMGWDAIGVSEDFNFHSQIWNEAWNDGQNNEQGDSYNSTTHRGILSVGTANLANYFSKKPLFNTDGLCLFYRMRTVDQQTLEQTETMVPWTTHYGYTDNGADGLITKGFRSYVMKLNDGTEIDLYILHMDAESSAEDNAARAVQLTQLVNYIKGTHNGRPIIVMGDTNCRYTRDDLRSLFISALNADERFNVHDAWIEFSRDGNYPTYGTNALMAHDLGYRKGEVVDKLFYINNTESAIRISPLRFTQDLSFINEEGEPLADHWPIVGEFEYHNYDPAIDDPAHPIEGPYDGKLFYLQNVRYKYFLKAGGMNLNKAIIGTYGCPVTIESLSDGTVRLHTPFGYVSHGDPLVDASEPDAWTIVNRGDNVQFTYKQDNQTMALGAGTGSTALGQLPGPNMRTLVYGTASSSNTAQQWRLMTADDLKQEMADATQESPVECTFLLPGANFDLGDDAGNATWTGWPSTESKRMTFNRASGTNSVNNDNSCAEIYVAKCPDAHTLSSCNHGTTWDLSQTLTGIPNGTYRLTAQAFQRVNYEPQGSADIILYANADEEQSLPVPLMYSEQKITTAGIGSTEDNGYYFPNTMSEASLYFTRGYYRVQIEEIKVSNGELKIGLTKRSDTGKNNSCWTCFDNFQLFYLGDGTTGISNTSETSTTSYSKAQKLVRNGQILIKLGGNTYSTTGARLK